MKRSTIAFSFFLSVLTVSAQNITIAHLRNKLESETSDTAKCKTLDSLAMYNMFFNNRSDSTFNYCNEYVNTAFQIPDKKYLILAYARLSFYYNNTGQYKESLSMALKGLDLAEQYHIQDYLSALYYDLSWFYFNSDDFKEGLESTLKGIAFLKFNKDPFFDQALHLYGMRGSLYLDINKTDSALFYFNRMDSVSATSTELGEKNITDWCWAIYYLYFKKDYQKTDSICSEAITECKKYGDFLLNFFYLFSSTSYLNQGKIEKAIAEAREAYALSLPITDPAAERFAAGLLNTCYEKSGNRDSAYYYLKLKDSLNNVIQAHSNAIEIQQFQFDQQLNKKEQEAATVKNQSKILIYVFLTAIIFFLFIAMIQWRNNMQRKRANVVLQQQKQKVESTLQELRSAQAQLIQNEKMASLGELTAGIAHEIQNPLNFVNNFSEVNKELFAEMNEEMSKGNFDEAKTIAKDIEDNEEKINHHGKRADAIVKGMLQHSRTSTGVKEPTDINALADEYLRLSYHGLRAKDKSFNATLKTDFDESLSADKAGIGKINIIPQDFGRVLLNLYNNAFYALAEKAKLPTKDLPGFENLAGVGNFEPTITVSTKKSGNKISITVSDNGNGIPQKVVDKIFQPFFTTKPTGQGTGLGLSLSYDIIKAHGGEIKVETKDGEGGKFIISLPVV
jgi:two-component system NtrC family sensor kinase